MTAKIRALPLIAISGTSLVVGCGGRGSSCGSYGSYGSYGSSGGCVAQSLDPAGVYEGFISNAATQQGVPVVMIIAENGDGRMASQDGSYYHVNIGAVGNNVTGTFAGFSQAGTLPNGSHSSSGAVSGFIVPNSLSATLTDATHIQQSLVLNFDNVYHMASSLVTLAGNWTFAANGFTLTATIQSDGAFTATDSNSCTYSGSFGLIDPNFNAYSETHVRICNGISDVFAGLATFIPAAGSAPTGAPTIIRLLTDDNSSEYLVADLQ